MYMLIAGTFYKKKCIPNNIEIIDIHFVVSLSVILLFYTEDGSKEISNANLYSDCNCGDKIN